MKNKREKDLGLPPMKLAETVSKNELYTKGDTLRIIGKFIKFLLVISIAALCAYMLYVYMSDDDLDEITSEEILVVDVENTFKIHNEGSNKFDIEDKLMESLLKSDPSESRKKRDTIAQNKYHFKTEKDAVNARTVIANHDQLCTENNKNEFCKNLMHKLQAVATIDDDPDFDSNKEISHSRRDMTFNEERTGRHIIKKKKTQEAYASHEEEVFYPIPAPLLAAPVEAAAILPSPLTETCLLARILKENPRHLHAVFDIPVQPQPAYSSSYMSGPPLSSYSRSPSYDMYHPISRIVDVEEWIPHPQDVEITMSRKLPASTDQQERSSSTCAKDFTPCDNGECVPSKQWCDGVVDCADVSDESRCSCVDRVDSYRLCDGYFDCPFGEDEMGCFGCPKNAFSCEDLDLNSRSSCFTKEQRCNNIPDCPNQKDEIDCNLLSPTLHEQPMFAVSNTEGFLQRNFRGDWYPVCANPYMWAHDACRRETGLIIRPPFIRMVPVDPLLHLTYMGTSSSGMLQTSESCANSSAVYVTCPDLLCGTRVLTTPQLLKENEESENKLFGRNKRYLIPDQDTVIAYFPNRFKRFIQNISLAEVNHIEEDISKEAPDRKEAQIDSLNPNTVEDESVSIDVIKPETLKRSKRTESRVVGGKPSQPAAWPWMISINRDGKFHCGGVVITDRWILSAAHCVTEFWEHYYEIQIGMLRRFSFSPQEQSLQVTHIIVNRHYNKENMKNDVTLLRVKPGLQFSRWVRPVCLPNPETAGPEWLWGPAPGTICTAVGWGATEEHGPDPDHIREVEVPVWGECKHREDKAGKEICAGLVEGGRDACQGDSGGPLLCRNPLNSHQWYMAGIVSHGEGCGRKGEPGVYTRVSMFVPWIKYHISSKLLPEIRPKQECPGFKCVSGISKCLPKDKLCDRVIDCLHGEDEIGCHFTKINSPKSIIDTLFFGRDAEEEHPVLNNTSGSRLRKIMDNDSDNDDNMMDDMKNASKLEISRSNSSGDKRNQDISSTEFESTREDNVSEEKSRTTDVERDTDITEDWSDIPTATQESIASETISIDHTTVTLTTESHEIETTTKSSTMQGQASELSISFFKNNTALKSDSLIANATSNADKESKGFELDLPLDSESLMHQIQSKNNKILHNNTAHTKEFTMKVLNDSKLVSAKEMIDKHVPDQFVCTNMFQVIPYKRRCDHKADCEDGSDEIKCRCVDYIVSLNRELYCDGVIDCADGEDEHHCYECEENRFLCQKSKLCLKNEFVCDGKLDCPEGDDELDCYALTNGTSLILGLDGRPLINLEGFVTKKRGSQWNIVCEDNLTVDKQEEEAVHICRYLGFSSANRLLVKYINVKDNILKTDKEFSVTKIRRDIESVPTFTYRETNADNTSREVEIRHPQLLKEECVPNVTKTCMSLYVFCERTLFDPSLLHIELEDNELARAEGKSWPWIAKVYLDGNYRCTGVLIDESWVLVANTCVQHAVLHHNYVTVVLGTLRTLSSSHGPYEQVLQVDRKKGWYNSHVMLLHLKQPVRYSHMVKPMVVTKFTNDGDVSALCVAIGEDNSNHTISLYLQETHDKCDFPDRCFKKLIKSPTCKPGTSINRRWSGIISCHNSYGWHPSASFTEELGECAVGNTIVAHDIGNLRSEIKDYLSSFVSNTTDVEIADTCEGYRCPRGKCVKLSQVCNGVSDCADGSDEEESTCHKKIAICTNDPHHGGCECATSEMKCKNGKCISKELFKNGLDDCGDLSDEPGHSTCAQYLARTTPMRLCDGVVHCHDKSDEDPLFCKCYSVKAHKCATSDHCVAQDTVCDGVPDCPRGEDEQTCLALTAPKGVSYGTGMVIKRYHGVWNTKCFSKMDHTRSELEDICRQLGFLNGHAKQLKSLPGFKNMPPTKIILDEFYDVSLNNKTVLKLRNSEEPLAKLVVDKEQAEVCYPVFIECI